ncbi:exonuclease REC1 [Sporisorium reilianum SRZ2]|uniref:Exonuclease REC1 n=1 Tax=Sporisorium reilianum (strain SRZ2) TaxID=999809 RepID=E7A2T1_SPORE|nr:exonuclease REC1 [Sporisorium reilianum SRZ2]
MPVEAPTEAASAMTLTASLSDVTGLANLLKSVAIQTHAVVIASSSGLEIVTELNRTLQAHAYLYSHMFDSYHFQKPSTNAQASTSRTRPQKRSKTGSKPGRNSDSQSPASSSESDDDLRSQSTAEPTRKRARGAEDEAAGGMDDEPESVSFEVNLQTWISCLNIFGGVGPSRPHSNTSSHSGSRQDQAGASSNGRAYHRTRDGTVDPYGADRGASVERGLDRNAFPAATKSTRMRLSYEGHGHPLVLELEQEANVLTRVSISTYEPSFLTDMVFDPHNMVAQVILGSELMQSAFAEIDASCKKLSIFMTSPHSASAPDDEERNETSTASRSRDKSISTSMLRFKAISDTGSSEMEFPASLSSADPTGVIEKFVALPGSSEQWYDFTLLSRTMTVLRSSIKTSLRMDEAGLISFQFMMPKYRRAPVAAGAAGAGAAQAVHEDEQDAFCEFLCCPLDTSTLIV